MAKIISVKLVIAIDDDADINDVVGYVLEGAGIASEAMEESGEPGFDIMGAGYDDPTSTDSETSQ